MMAESSGSSGASSGGSSPAPSSPTPSASPSSASNKVNPTYAATGRAAALAGQPTPQQRQQQTTREAVASMRPSPQQQYQRTAKTVAETGSRTAQEANQKRDALKQRQQQNHAERTQRYNDKKNQALNSVKREHLSDAKGNNKVPLSQKDYNNMYKAYAGEHLNKPKYKNNGQQLYKDVAHQIMSKNNAHDTRKLSNAIKNSSPEAAKRSTTAERRNYANTVVAHAYNKHHGNKPREENTRKPSYAAPSAAMQQTGHSAAKAGFSSNDGSGSLPPNMYTRGHSR
ncbi:hypothetical protein [Nostoc sp. CHAB 5715]|uniref:hypothetical protein n=1 Tax=Nostoc sp. CHAB 5715 TaxID=2780400 RepID=UPI001E521260|nr:hypothetical protein [Nostoc sp. CHAB 5715]MCC5624049.1 hypothetical protein [Nostoc sp. CHAB 5715]